MPAQGLENGPEFYHARSRGHRRPKIHAVTVFAPLKIGGRSFERAHQCFAMPTKNDTAVVRNIEGLCASSDHESAISMPSQILRIDGNARAQRPNAPST